MTVANVQLLLHRLWPNVASACGSEARRPISTPPARGPRLARRHGQPDPAGRSGTQGHNSPTGFSPAAETLADGPARGVSNRIVEPGARIELTSGALLVVHTPHDSSPGA
jgi:hypothetical protein